jgi:hypothetical protein
MLTLIHWGYHWGDSAALPLPIVIGVVLAELGAILAIVESILVWRLVPKAFRMGPIAMVSIEPIKCPHGFPTRTTGETADLKYRVVDKGSCVLRNRWDREPSLFFGLKGEASFQGDNLILTVRYPIGMLGFVAGWALIYLSIALIMLLYYRIPDMAFVCGVFLSIPLLSAIIIRERRRWRGLIFELKSVLTETTAR